MKMTFTKKMKVVLNRLERDGYIAFQFPCECCGEPTYVVHNPAFPLPNPDEPKEYFIINDRVGNQAKQYTLFWGGGAEDAAQIIRRLADIGCTIRTTQSNDSNVISI
jgi:hypothetical protein